MLHPYTIIFQELWREPDRHVSDVDESDTPSPGRRVARTRWWRAIVGLGGHGARRSAGRGTD